MEKKFRVLRLYVTVLKVLAWIALAGGIIGGLIIIVAGAAGGGLVGGAMRDYGLSGGGLVAAILAGLGVAIGGLLAFVGWYAAAEFIGVWLSIEQNTRETAYFLRGERNLPPPPPAV